MSNEVFDEIRIDDQHVIYGTTGGPGFQTDIVSLNSGFEYRNVVWPQGRGKWELGERTLFPNELQALIAFFRARQGRARGFRFKDWADYTDNGTGVLGTSNGSGNTSTVLQMYKRYDSGSQSYLRAIAKPVSGTVTVYKNGSQITPTTIDYTTGLVTLASAPINTDTLTWKGQFDVPVRFDVDELKTRFDAANVDPNLGVTSVYYYLSSTPIIELRV